MPWVARRQTYEGDSLLSFSEREATAYHTIVLLRCLYWPISVYSNKEYNPDRAVYGRLTEMRRSIEYETVEVLGAGGTPLFVENDRLIHFPDNVIYDRSIPLARIQRLYAEGMLKLLDELDDPDIPILAPLPKKKALLTALYWVSTAIEESDDNALRGEYGIAGHGNRKFALSTHPNSVWEWTVLSFLSDFLASTEEEDDPEGDDPGAPDSPTDAPPGELPPGGIDTDEPPAGTPPGWFDEPPEEPPSDGPVGPDGPTEFTIILEWFWIKTSSATGTDTDVLNRTAIGPIDFVYGESTSTQGVNIIDGDGNQGFLFSNNVPDLRLGDDYNRVDITIQWGAESVTITRR